MTSNTAIPVLAGQDGAIRAVFDEVSSAWADGNADEFIASYAEEATVILPGIYLAGRDAIRASMRAAFAGPLSGSRRIHRVRSIRHVGIGTAVAVSNSATVFQGEDEPPAERWERATCLLTRHDGPWLIEAFHSCPRNAA
jgi:uncharacterized protein (TIGR02246 family)